MAVFTLRKSAGGSTVRGGDTLQSIAGGGVTQDITPGLAQSLASSFNPTLTYEAFITPGLVQQLAVAYDPVVSPGVVYILPDLLQQLVAGIDPTIGGTIDMQPGLANQSIVVYDPTVANILPTQDISPNLMQQLALAYDPTIAPGTVVISVDLFVQLINAYGPIIGGDGQPDASSITTMSDWSG